LSPVTEADRAIEAMARRLVGARHPELGVLGEEEGAAPGSAAARLIIDPIDGTRNFVRGIPIFGVLLAIEEDGEVAAGLASAPALRTRWHGARGAGAFRDGRRIAVSRVRALESALLLHGNLGAREPAPPPGFAALARQVERTRGFADFYQHVLVAEGAGEIAVDPAAHPWDIAAVQVIVEEAGGTATALGGERSIYAGSLVTSNGVLHQRALEALRRPEGALL
jgi:histidinol-phosphatase